MRLDYKEMGARIAQRRRKLGLKQSQLCQAAGISNKYLSCIERANSIPSLDVLVRLALALDSTVDEFLGCSIRHDSDSWRDVAELLRDLEPHQLKLAKSFLLWLQEENPGLPETEELSSNEAD